MRKSEEASGSSSSWGSPASKRSGALVNQSTDTCEASASRETMVVECTEKSASSRNDRPPLNVVIVKETASSGGASLSSPSTGTRGTSNLHKPDLQMSMSPFKLRPRNITSTVSKPPFGESSCGNRGHKRRAQCISVPMPSSFATVEEATLRKTPSTLIDGGSTDGRTVYPRHRHLGHSIFTPKSESDTSTCTSLDSSPATHHHAPSTCEVDVARLKNMSLQSPVKRAASFESSSPSSLAESQQTKSRESSFTLYNGSSPSRSIRRSWPSPATTSSAFKCKTPSSSSRSSPRQVPLTLVSDSRASPQNSAHLLPLHIEASALLYSLDGSTDADDEHEAVLSSLPESAVASSNASVQSTAGGPPRPNMYESPSSRSAVAPRTPLPKINLTPRTPGSSGGRQRQDLPMFPSNYDKDDTDVAQDGHKTEAVGRETMDHLLDGFANICNDDVPVSHVQLTLNRELSTSGQYRLTHPMDKVGTTRDEQLTQDSSAPAPRRNLGLGPTSLGETCFTVKTRSLLSPSQSSGMFEDLLKSEALRGVVDAETGSLSDSYDEDEFVLSCPGQAFASPLREVVSEGSLEYFSDLNNRARQRRRQSEDTPTLGLAVYGSTTSLTSGLASSTSLLGMDIVHEECSTCAGAPFGANTNKPKSPRSGNALCRRHSEDGLIGYSLRRKSEHSLGSLGLCLDGSITEDVGGREMVTPPVTSNCALTPPPLEGRPEFGKLCVGIENGEQRQTNVCIANADKLSITSAIANMAWEAQRPQSAEM